MASDSRSVHRVGVLLGTRPEAIKLAPVVLALRDAPWLEPVVVSTGQHADLVTPVLAAFGIGPAQEEMCDLGLMRPGQELSDLAGRATTAIGQAIADLGLAAVIVQGDTTTTLAGALAGFYRGVPVVHVEAGLRTGDRRAPWPEEANRRMITQVADLHCAPTDRAARALLAEGVAAESVLHTGNTVVDALVAILASGAGYTGQDAGLLQRLDDAEGRLLLVTAHRRESWGAGLEGIAHGVAAAAAMHPDLEIVVPLHPNPRVRDALVPVLAPVPRVHLIDALDYPDFARLLRRADLVLTDSGGIQEEACTLGRPTLVARTVTERPEGTEAGGLRLVGTSPVRIAAEIDRLLRDPVAYDALVCRSSPFGDGAAAARIVAALDDLLRPAGDRPLSLVP